MNLFVVEETLSQVDLSGKKINAFHIPVLFY